MSQKKHTVVRLPNNQREKEIPFIIALADKVLDALNFVDFINRTVEWDEQQCKVSPGNLAKAVVLATFFEVRTPFSSIGEQFENVDTQFLFGEGVMPKDLTDDAIGRILDKIAQASPEQMYTTLCLTAYAVYKIAFRRLHSDTKTISFYGDYLLLEGNNFSDLNEYDLLSIGKGYNKNQLPVCNQVVVGKIVNEHGIPVANSVMDGNTSDAEWNTKALSLVSEVFDKELEQYLYIADSKLMNKNLFKTMTDPEKNIQFIFRCPANFSNKLESRVTEQAYLQNEWVDLGTISDKKNASEYKMQEFVQTVDDRDVRCIVYRTSEGTQRFENKKNKALKELEQAIVQVQKKEFICEADAIKELQRFQNGNKRSIYDCSAIIVPTTVKKQPRGNPGKNPKPAKIETKWHLQIKINGESYEFMEKLRRKEECFVLISNADKNTYDGRNILENYKNKSIVEIQFRLLKEPCIASVIYLDTPDRIRALVMLFGISLLIRALVQYKLRKGYRESKKDLPKIGWNGAKLKPNITIFFFIEALNNHAFIREKDGEYSYSFANDYKELQITTLLDLMGIKIEDLLN